MKVLIDPQIFWWQKYGGVSRYVAEVYDYMRQQDGTDVSMPLLAHENAYLSDKQIHSESSFFDYVGKVRFKGSDRLRRLLSFPHENKLLNVLKKQEHDLLVPSYYYPYFLKEIGSMPYVLTVHDMTHELYPKLVPGVETFLKEKKAVIDGATHLIAISECTKNDLIRFYPSSEGKITVIYHGFTAEVSNTECDMELPEKYILFVGKRMDYKNFGFLLEAMAELLNEDKDLKLICAGSPSFDAEETEKIKALGVTDSVMHVPVDDTVLAHLYRNAVCFVFPSLNEGFGFPVLEAMACGCPTVLTKSSSFPEVAGDAGIYYEDQAGLTNVVQSLLNDDLDRESLIQKGYEQIEKFSWEKCVQETMDLYEKVASEHSSKVSNL